MSTNYSFIQKSLAWSVHIFTASGLIAGFLAILAINEQDWRTAMFWLIICLVIDGIDGTFARLFKVQEVLPYMDGKTIDYVVDFVTYAVIPAYFVYQADLVAEVWKFPSVSLILLVSAVYYGKEGMVSESMHFIGFPVLWNMVVFYLIFVTDLSKMGNLIVIIIFAIMHFMPIKFAYPSQMMRFKWMTLGVTVTFILTLIMLVFYYPVKPLWLTIVAVAAAAYFGALGIYETWIIDEKDMNTNNLK